MTKQEYNENLLRYYKAMKWFESKPEEDKVDKFYNDFLEVLEKLRVGTLELKPTPEEMTRGFSL